MKETLVYYIWEAGWDKKTNRVLGWVKDEFIDSEPVVYSGGNKLMCYFDGKELKEDCVANIHDKPRLMEDECVCKNRGLEKGDTLYISSDWDGGIGFDYIHNIKFCPVCGKELSEWRGRCRMGINEFHNPGMIQSPSDGADMREDKI